MSDTVRILSIDGGGIRGIIPAMVIQALLGELKAQEVFHIISGTSTGGIIACGLAKPNPISLQQLVDLYVQHGGDIFKRNFLESLPGSDFVRPKYEPTALQSYLDKEFGATHLSDINNTELLIPSYAIGLPNGKPPAPMFFRSWQARGLLLGEDTTASEYDFRLSAIARATSAAPTYFQPEMMQNKASQTFTMIDGGVFANNPTMCAIIEAHRLYHSSNFLVVSIGTGADPTRLDPMAAEGWGETNWLLPILSILMSGGSQTTCVEVDEMLRDKHWRFDIPLLTKTPEGESVDDAMDDASPANIQALQDKAKELIDNAQDRIQTLAKLLTVPKANLAIKNTLPSKGILLSMPT